MGDFVLFCDAAIRRIHRKLCRSWKNMKLVSLDSPSFGPLRKNIVIVLHVVVLYI